MRYLSNAFSLGMLPAVCSPTIREHTKGNFKKELTKAPVKSIVGHADTANILTKILDSSVAFNRETVSLKTGDVLFVAQYDGPRLCEGATELPEGANFRWFIVEVR